MKYLLVLLGCLVACAGLLIAAKPETVLRYIGDHAGSRELHAAAIAARLALGIALLLYAEASRFPVAFLILGWLSLAAAVFLMVIGRRRMKRLIDRVLGSARRFARPAGIAALLFGGFIVYAVV